MRLEKSKIERIGWTTSPSILTLVTKKKRADYQYDILREYRTKRSYLEANQLHRCVQLDR
jgi:hypothetical protein